MVIMYLNDQLVRAPERPRWMLENVPDGAEFVRLTQRYYRDGIPHGERAYSEYLESRHWRIFRYCCMVVAKGRCGKCEGQATDLHHLTYDRVGGEYLSDVMPLCRKCHAEEHADKKGKR